MLKARVSPKDELEVSIIGCSLKHSTKGIKVADLSLLPLA